MLKKLVSKLTNQKLITYLIEEMATLVALNVIIMFIVVTLSSNEDRLYKMLPYVLGISILLLVYCVYAFVKLINRDLTEDELQQIKRITNNNL